MTKENVKISPNQDVSVAAYVRVSTKEQSLEMQKADIERKLAFMKVENVVFYQDKSTGTNDKRPGLQMLLQDINEGKVKTVIVWKIDRLFRSLKHMMNLLTEWNEKGVEFISIKDNIDLTTSSGKLMFQILACFAEFESNLIKERCGLGQQEAMARGVVFGRKRKLDYEPIFRLRRKGWSANQIAKELGIPLGTITSVLRRHYKSVPRGT